LKKWGLIQKRKKRDSKENGKRDKGEEKKRKSEIEEVELGGVRSTISEKSRRRASRYTKKRERGGIEGGNALRKKRRQREREKGRDKTQRNQNFPFLSPTSFRLAMKKKFRKKEEKGLGKPVKRNKEERESG